jgi:hypothetical protein
MKQQGCPILAFFARVGTMVPHTLSFGRIEARTAHPFAKSAKDAPPEPKDGHPATKLKGKSTGRLIFHRQRLEYLDFP